MKRDLNNLRVAVVPTETGNDINQESPIKKILACKETQFFTLPEYFNAQNNEDIDLLHFSFLVDIKTKENLTRMKLPLDIKDTKEEKIQNIKDILSVWGGVTVNELELENSPCISVTGTNKNTISTLIDGFYPDCVKTITYHNETEVNEESVEYENLSEEIIDVIVEIIEDYESKMLEIED
jgi:hypothetical protein